LPSCQRRLFEDAQGGANESEAGSMSLMTTKPQDSARVTKITQVDAAVVQLHRAVALFINEQDYISAVTLACASEAITGEYLQGRKIKPHTEELKEAIQLRIAPDLSHKEINDLHINRARNFMKHKICGEHEQVEFDLEGEAICAIVRACSNLALLTETVSGDVEAFFEWLKVHRPDLTDRESLERTLRP
jgi:hypothetical protein